MVADGAFPPTGDASLAANTREAHTRAARLAPCRRAAEPLLAGRSSERDQKQVARKCALVKLGHLEDLEAVGEAFDHRPVEEVHDDPPSSYSASPWWVPFP